MVENSHELDECGVFNESGDPKAEDVTITFRDNAGAEHSFSVHYTVVDEIHEIFAGYGVPKIEEARDILVEHAPRDIQAVMNGLDIDALKKSTPPLCGTPLSPSASREAPEQSPPPLPRPRPDGPTRS